MLLNRLVEQLMEIQIQHPEEELEVIGGSSASEFKVDSADFDDGCVWINLS